MDYKRDVYAFPIIIFSLLGITYAIELSESCRMEKIALQQNDVLQQQFIKNIKAVEFVKTDCESNGGNVACVYDYTETAEQVGHICSEEGGQFMATGFGAYCGDDKNRMEVYYNNYPLCYGVRCQHDDVANLIKSHIDDLEKSLSAHGFDCDVHESSENEAESSADQNYALSNFYALIFFSLIRMII